MRHAGTWRMIALASALMGCDPSTGSGVRPDPLPSSVQKPCPHPSGLVSRGGKVSDDKISLGRVGLALIACEASRKVAADAYEELRTVVAGPS